jgi:hypothetical protein
VGAAAPKTAESPHAYFIRSNVFCSSARSLGWPSFSRVLSTHFFSSAFLVGQSRSLAAAAFDFAEVLETAPLECVADLGWIPEPD